MGFRKWLGIDNLEKENKILRDYVKNQNLILQNIDAKVKQYKQVNNSIAHVGFEKIENYVELGLDYAAEKEMELSHIN